MSGLRRLCTRSRSQSTLSSLQPGLSAPQVLTQPLPRLTQPSPRPPRRATQPAREEVLTNRESIPFNVAPINISESLTDTPDEVATNENTACPFCTLQVNDISGGVLCERCMTWFHPECLFMTNEEYITLNQNKYNGFAITASMF